MPTQSWIITTAVGTGERGFSGDGGPATSAVLNGPFDVGFDTDGNLYFSDTFNHRIRRVDGRTGIITTCAGSGEAGYSGDGGPAVGARLNEPYGIAVDQTANVYIADRPVDDDAERAALVVAQHQDDRVIKSRIADCRRRDQQLPGQRFGSRGIVRRGWGAQQQHRQEGCSRQ